MTEERDPVVAREVAEQLERIREGSVDFIGEEELAGRLALGLREGRPLRVKLGMDPSSPDLHLGHAVVLDKLRLFQDLGHTPTLVIGDFTARIGDPSGRKKTRPALGQEEVRANAATYTSQVARFLDVEAAEIRFNSEWMDAMTPQDFVRLCSHVTLARLLERDDFAKRFASETPISVHEFLYPFVQGYDSVALEADIEIGGTDQTFNLLMGREIQRAYGQTPQAVLTHPLLVGTDGHDKMSKSLDNSIAVLDPPQEIYGKIMSLSDTGMLDYFSILGGPIAADLESEREAVAGGGGDPLGLKQELARRLVARFHDEAAAREAAAHFKRVVQEGATPESVPQHAFSLDGAEQAALIDLVTREEGGRARILKSKSEFRRLVAQGAVQVDGEPVSDPLLRLGAGSYLLKLGRRRFAAIDLS